MEYNFKVGAGKIAGNSIIFFSEGDLKNFSDFCKEILDKHICSKGYFEAEISCINSVIGRVPAIVFRIDSESVLMKPSDKDTYISVFDLSEFPEKDKLTKEHESILGI